MSVTLHLPQSGVLPVRCPAGEAVAGARTVEGMETPAVRCRIVHESFDMLRDARTVALACCCSAVTESPEPAPMPMTEAQRATARIVGFEHCDIWRFDKDRIAAGGKSLGDEVELAEEERLVENEDVTGSRYGDRALADELDRQATETAARIRAHHEDADYE